MTVTYQFRNAEQTLPDVGRLDLRRADFPVPAIWHALATECPADNLVPKTDSWIPPLVCYPCRL